MDDCNQSIMKELKRTIIITIIERWELDEDLLAENYYSSMITIVTLRYLSRMSMSAVYCGRPGSWQARVQVRE